MNTIGITIREHMTSSGEVTDDESLCVWCAHRLLMEAMDDPALIREGESADDALRRLHPELYKDTQ